MSIVLHDFAFLSTASSRQPFAHRFRRRHSNQITRIDMLGQVALHGGVLLLRELVVHLPCKHG